MPRAGAVHLIKTHRHRGAVDTSVLPPEADELGWRCERAESARNSHLKQIAHARVIEKGKHVDMTLQRVVILGRGGAGKSTLGRRLSELAGVPVIELDKHFWQPGLAPLSREEWAEVQRKLASQSCWIMDGDLGAYDSLPVRLSMADTVLLLDFPLWLCLWRTLRRGKERWDFWWWVITWRLLERPKLRDMLAKHPNAQVHILRSQKEVDQLLSKVAPSC